MFFAFKIFFIRVWNPVRYGFVGIGHGHFTKNNLVFFIFYVMGSTFGCFRTAESFYELVLEDANRDYTRLNKLDRGKVEFMYNYRRSLKFQVSHAIGVVEYREETDQDREHYDNEIVVCPAVHVTAQTVQDAGALLQLAAAFNDKPYCTRRRCFIFCLKLALAMGYDPQLPNLNIYNRTLLDFLLSKNYVEWLKVPLVSKLIFQQNDPLKWQFRHTIDLFLRGYVSYDGMDYFFSAFDSLGLSNDHLEDPRNSWISELLYYVIDYLRFDRRLFLHLVYRIDPDTNHFAITPKVRKRIEVLEFIVHHTNQFPISFWSKSLIGIQDLELLKSKIRARDSFQFRQLNRKYQLFLPEIVVMIAQYL